MKQNEVVAVLQMRTCSHCGAQIRTDSARLCARCREARPASRKSSRCALTSRERQIALLVGQAKLNKEIASELRLSEGTVKEYLHRIFSKVGAKNRTDLAIWILRNEGAADFEPLSAAG